MLIVFNYENYRKKMYIYVYIYVFPNIILSYLNLNVPLSYSLLQCIQPIAAVLCYGYVTYSSFSQVHYDIT